MTVARKAIPAAMRHMQATTAAAEVTEAEVQQRWQSKLDWICWFLSLNVMGQWAAVVLSNHHWPLKAAATVVLLVLMVVTPLALKRAPVRLVLGNFLALAVLAAMIWLPLFWRGRYILPKYTYFGMLGQYFASLMSLLLLWFDPKLARAVTLGVVLTAALVAKAIDSFLHPTQPAMHYIVGGQVPKGEMGYSITGYSQAIHFYPDNPRGYFEEESAINPWHGWHLIDKSGSGLKPSVKFQSGVSPRVRIAGPRTGEDTPWNVTWHCDLYRYQAGKRYRALFRARSDAPREVLVQFQQVEPFEVLSKAAIQVTTEWQSFAVEFAAQKDSARAGISFVLGTTRSPIELADWQLEEDGQVLADDPKLSRCFIRYETNRLGFRDREFVTPRPANVFRIACLGDSFTWGQGVKQEDVYPRVLERLLNQERRKDGLHFEVMNCGRMSYATREERICFEEEVLPLEPQLVILQMLENDNVQGFETPTRKIDNDVRRTFEECAQELEKLVARCEQENCHVALFLFNPLGFNFESSALRADVLPTARALRVPVLDFVALYGQRRGRSFLRAPDLEVHSIDAHPNEVANRLAAEYLLEFLMQQQLLPADESGAGERSELSGQF